MQKVSDEYKESMKSPLRERAYIMISFGLVNQEAQENAKLKAGALTEFSDGGKIFKRRSDATAYATLEENFTPVDGSMYFLPRNQAAGYLDTGITSEDLVSSGSVGIQISLGAPADFKGLTINFGENYPVSFDISGGDGEKIEVRGNESTEYVTEEVFSDTSTLTITVYEMKNPNSRLRIYSILFGYGLVYYNDSVLDSTMECFVSPIAEEVPQINFKVKLTNYDKYFNVDNPNSAINFLETGQEMDVFYGYELPNGGGVEWIKGNHLLCSNWDSDEYSATIRCTDVFMHMDEEYYVGEYSSEGKSYYELAVAVLTAAGVSSYKLDPVLKTIKSKNPIPRVTHKEALQMIANACRCVLAQTRDGEVEIRANFEPEVSVESNGEAPYSSVSAILSSEEKDEYASLSGEYTVVDGGMWFLPEDMATATRNTGFISESVSGEDCKFSTNPILTMKLEAARAIHGLKIVFGQSVPSWLEIRTFKDGNLAGVYAHGAHGNVDVREVVFDYYFDEFDTMEIEFEETREPFNRIVVNHLAIGDTAVFSMERIDMTSSPKAVKQELVKAVVVPCYIYQPSEQEESLASEDITVTAGDEVVFYVESPSYGYRATLDGAASSGASIVSSGSYYVSVKFSVTGSYKFELFGRKYNVVERTSSVKLNERGKTVKWENPLVSDLEVASNLAQWLAEYYASGIEYEYSTRGNPELDATDVIYQENEFVEKMTVTVTETVLRFKQSFSGSIKARRKGG